MAPLPLEGLLVLDLSIARAGPTAVRLLSDWGADVIRIEPPGENSAASITGDNLGPDSQNLHRNKRALRIDLKHPDGQKIFRRLVSKADIVVENFRSEVKTRLKLNFTDLSKINARIILASISGFGQDGPYVARPGVDQIIQGMSGLMSITGEPGSGPMRTGIAISDTSAGMFLGQGILLALLDRGRTGLGQWVHTSLLESMLSKLDFQAARYTMNGEVPSQTGNFHPQQVPMGLFDSKDGQVNLAASTDKMWFNFCEALSATNLRNHPNYASVELRSQHQHDLNHAVNGITRGFTSAQLVERLNGVGVPCGPVLNMAEAFDDEQVKHLKMTKVARHETLGNINLLRTPLTLSACPQPEKFHHAGPAPGQHSREILESLDFDAAQIQDFEDRGII